MKKFLIGALVASTMLTPVMALGLFDTSDAADAEDRVEWDARYIIHMN